MGEQRKYQEYIRSFEGSGSPFFPAPALRNMADRVRSGVVVDLRRPCPGLIDQVGASRPAPMGGVSDRVVDLRPRGERMAR